MLNNYLHNLKANWTPVKATILFLSCILIFVGPWITYIQLKWPREDVPGTHQWLIWAALGGVIVALLVFYIIMKLIMNSRYSPK